MGVGGTQDRTDSEGQRELQACCSELGKCCWVSKLPRAGREIILEIISENLRSSYMSTGFLDWPNLPSDEL